MLCAGSVEGVSGSRSAAVVAVEVVVRPNEGRRVDRVGREGDEVVVGADASSDR